MTTRTCPECRTEFTTAHHSKKFCSNPCKKAFNNRRMTRGAVVYDAFMSMRYDRGWAKAAGLWTLLCAIASEWRAEDNDKGRDSYIRADDWVAENKAWLKSVHLGNVKTGRGA